MFLYNVTCYDKNKNEILHCTIEAMDKHRAAHEVTRELIKIYGKQIINEGVSIVAAKR